MPTKVFDVTPVTLPSDAAAAWAAIPVTIASDITAGRVVVDPLIRPLRPFAIGRRLVGRAVTAWCERSDFGAMLHAIDIAGAGDIVVVAAGGCLQTAYAGEILCGYARKKGIAGLIVDGAVRDIDTIAAFDDFSVFARGHTPRGPLSKERGTVNGRIVLGGTAVAPGDIILGDNDGLAAIPAGEASTLLTTAQARVQMEEQWVAQLASGGTLVSTFAVPEAI
ncbi:RraA family protein [Aestuariivirga sp. YIM B02566]|uniref:RraA family protein n=1 Tax=Taklimakanibacter albus TaxID=2800327 RepID=A0ACC5QZB3_9HYPH|nr:RraA family protein [Aestuariivirga sp. YIM B02566]MBK1865735.1 RraA family protein [Aestuariivirga sp. YIM B02566]